MPRSVTNALNLLLLSLLIGLSILVYDSLPQEIPVHYGADGTPDRFTSTSWLSWMVLPLIALALTCLMEFISRILPRVPDQLNVPQQKKYQALPLADKLIVISGQQDLLAQITLGMNVMFVALQYGAYQVSMGLEDTLPWWAVGCILGFVVFTMVVAIRAIQQRSTLINALTARQ